MDDELLNDYLEEASDIMERVSALMDVLTQRPVNSEDIDDLFRSIHTVKGGAGMFGWENLQGVGHALETYLGECKKDISKFDYKFVRSEVDIVENLLENNDDASIIEKERINLSHESEENSAKTSYHSYLFNEFVDKFGEIMEEQLSQGIRFFEFKIPIVVSEKFMGILSRNGFEKFSEEVIEDQVAYLISCSNEKLLKNPQMLIKLAELESFHEVQKQENKTASPSNVVSFERNENKDITSEKNNDVQRQKKTDVLRVPTKTVNDSLNSIWEIFLLRNQIAYLFEKNKDFLKSNIDMMQEWEILDNALKRNIAELESTAMSMRMNNLSSLFSRMKKVVRSYQKNSNKEIEFSTAGDEIELDKKVIDMLGEPLIHLVRNAMDHGIEERSTRRNVGKPSNGSISLKAKSLSDKILIVIEDDGKGIDSEKILTKAIENGMDVSNIKTKEEAVNLIFSAGFSTAEEVTDVSGRGVGMDAVRRSIQKLGGEIFIETNVGVGSKFIIELPLSMAVISSILFEVNGKSYGCSINNLIEVCREPKDILEVNNGAYLFPYRGEFLECYDLRDYFNPTEEYEDTNEIATFCIMEVNGRKGAIRVDRVSKHTDIVVKEAKGVFPDIDCVNGVSILATGEPIFVVSLTKIFRAFKEGLVHAA